MHRDIDITRPGFSVSEDDEMIRRVTSEARMMRQQVFGVSVLWGGDLSQFSLPTVLNMMGMADTTGMLEIMADRWVVMEVKGGRPLNVKVDGWLVSDPVEILSEMMDWNRGAFFVLGVNPDGLDTINTSLDKLMIEVVHHQLDGEDDGGWDNSTAEASLDGPLLLGAGDEEGLADWAREEIFDELGLTPVLGPQLDQLIILTEGTSKPDRNNGMPEGVIQGEVDPEFPLNDYTPANPTGWRTPSSVETELPIEVEDDEPELEPEVGSMPQEDPEEGDFSFSLFDDID